MKKLSSTVSYFAPRTFKRSESGFTLIEVLIALTVTAIVLSTVYGIFSGVSTARDRLEQDGEVFHQARVLFDRMGREIRSTYYLGDADHTLFRGGENEDERFFLELTTTVVSPTLPQATGISRVLYEVRDNPDDRAAPPILIRREESLLPGGAAGTMENRLVSNITAFRVRFHDGTDWQEQWQSDRQGLPQMVELYLEMESDGESRAFRTAFDIPQLGSSP